MFIEDINEVLSNSNLENVNKDDLRSILVGLFRQNDDKCLLRKIGKVCFQRDNIIEYKQNKLIKNKLCVFDKRKKVKIDKVRIKSLFKLDNIVFDDLYYDIKNNIESYFSENIINAIPQNNTVIWNKKHPEGISEIEHLMSLRKRFLEADSIIYKNSGFSNSRGVCLIGADAFTSVCSLYNFCTLNTDMDWDSDIRYSGDVIKQDEKDKVFYLSLKFKSNYIYDFKTTDEKVGNYCYTVINSFGEDSKGLYVNMKTYTANPSLSCRIKII